MLDSTEKSWKYYKDKTPLYIQTDGGMLEQFKMFWSFLSHCDDVEDDICDIIGIMELDPDKLDSDDLPTDILDKIGNLFNLSRTFSFTYYEGSTARKQDTAAWSWTDSAGNTNYGLNNKEYLRYLQIKILNQKFDGTVSSISEAYRNTTFGDHIFNIPIYYLQLADEPAHCSVYFLDNRDSDVQFDNHEKLMFRGGVYNEEMLGIIYTYTIIDSTIGIWDYAGSKGNWDEAKWG